MNFVLFVDLYEKTDKCEVHEIHESHEKGVLRVSDFVILLTGGWRGVFDGYGVFIPSMRILR